MTVLAYVPHGETLSQPGLTLFCTCAHSIYLGKHIPAGAIGNIEIKVIHFQNGWFPPGIGLATMQTSFIYFIVPFEVRGSFCSQASSKDSEISRPEGPGL